MKLGVLIGFLVVVVVGCGEKYCFMGLGDCEELLAGSGVSSCPTISASKTVLSQNEELALTTSGGSEPRTVSLTVGSGATVDDDSFSSSGTGVFVVRVTDNDNKIADLALLVTSDTQNLTVSNSVNQISIEVNDTITLTATGGSGSYTFAEGPLAASSGAGDGEFSGTGNSSFRATSEGPITIRATDQSNSTTGDAVILIVPDGALTTNECRTS